MITERGSYSEAWCETCGYRIQNPDMNVVIDAADEHEHAMIGQDIALWRSETGTDDHEVTP